MNSAFVHEIASQHIEDLRREAAARRSAKLAQSHGRERPGPRSGRRKGLRGILAHQ